MSSVFDQIEQAMKKIDEEDHPQPIKIKKGRKSIEERVVQIFHLIDKRGEIVSSEAQAIGLNKNDMERWGDIILYIQKQPKLIRTQVKGHTYFKLEK